MRKPPKPNRPLIAVSPSCAGGRPTLSGLYLDALWRAGGLGVMLPYTADPVRLGAYAEMFDGFLFSGGVDIDPARYGETKQVDCVDIDPARDEFEAGLFDAVYPTGKPVLGICRGIQAVNVFLGGTLHQHIEGHMQTAAGDVCEQVITVEKGSLLHNICGQDSLRVNSFHHQAVKTPAPALAVDARTPDGCVEALHDPRHPFLLALQFHPERAPSPESALIFKAFVEKGRDA